MIDRFFLLITTKDEPSPDRFDGTIYWFDLQGSEKLSESVRDENWTKIEDIAEQLHDGEATWIGSEEVIAYAVHDKDQTLSGLAEDWAEELKSLGFICGDIQRSAAETYMNRFHPETNMSATA